MSLEAQEIEMLTFTPGEKNYLLPKKHHDSDIPTSTITTKSSLRLWKNVCVHYWQVTCHHRKEYNLEMLFVLLFPNVFTFCEKINVQKAQVACTLPQYGVHFKEWIFSMARARPLHLNYSPHW